MTKLLTIFAVLLPSIALADEVVTTVDFSSWGTAAVPVLTTLLGLLLATAINWLVKKTGTEKLVAKEQVQVLVDKIMLEASNYAIANLKTKNWLKVETKNEALGFALNYVEEHGPDIVKAAGLDTTKILQKLEAKLDETATANPDIVTAHPVA